MSATTSFLNAALDGAIANVTGLYGPISVALFSGGGTVEVSGGGYAKQNITQWNAASGAMKESTARVNFSPVGMHWSYDQIRLYAQTGSLLLHSVMVSPVQNIADGSTHQILIRLSGS